jgi:tetratricopeptide (TPR) repeat protein
MAKIIALTVSLFIICSLRTSGSDSPWIGKTVVQRYPDVHFKMQDQEFIPNYISPFIVTESVGIRLYVQVKGAGHKLWVRTEDVVDLYEGIRFFDRQTKRKPRDSWNYFMLSMCWEELGKHEHAIYVIDRGISLVGDTACLYQQGGKILNELGKYDESIIYFKESIKLSNEYILFSDISQVYSNMKDYENAMNYAKKSVQYMEHSQDAYLARGRAYLGKSKYEKAITDFNKSIDLDPYFVEAYYQRGRTFSIMGQQDKAIADYKKAVQLDPRHVKAKHELHNLLFSLFPPQNPRL